MTVEDFNGAVSILKEQYAKINDFCSLSGFLLLNRIGGLFYNRAEAIGIKYSPKSKKLLCDTFLAQKRKVEFMRNEIRIVSDRLIERSVACAFLKGSVLTNLEFGGQYIYSDGERVSNDIDILVKPHEINSVGDSLKELGYIQGKYNYARKGIEPFSRTEILKRRMTRGEVAPYVKLTGNPEFPYVEIDINFSLGNTPHENTELLYEMVDSAVVFNGKIPLKTMPSEYFFLHLLLHQYKECELYFSVARQKDTDIYKLIDIYYLIKTGAINWATIDKIVQKHALGEKVGAVLAQVREIFNDNAVTELTKKYDGVQPQVIDYETMRRFRWTDGFLERVLHCNALALLEEINYDTNEMRN